MVVMPPGPVIVRAEPSLRPPGRAPCPAPDPPQTCPRGSPDNPGPGPDAARAACTALDADLTEKTTGLPPLSKEAGPDRDRQGDVAAGDVTAIVVNYGTAELALAAVDSLLAHPARLAGVHLVDNASPGGDAIRLAAGIAARGWQGRVVLHAETVNHGFGRGNNLVISALLAARAEGGAREGKVFLLNPDARLANDATRRMAEFLDAHPRAGAVGAAIAQPDAAGVPCPVVAAFRFPSLTSVFVEAVNFGPLSRLFRHRLVALPPGLPTGRVDWVSGAAVMVRLEALAEVGGFDPEFFLYYEEVELLHRLASAGWECWHLAEAQVLHAEGVATGIKGGQRRRRPGYWYDSWRIYMTRTQGRAGAVLAALLWLAGGALDRGIAILRRRNPTTPPAFFSDVTTRVLGVLLRGEAGR